MKVLGPMKTPGGWYIIPVHYSHDPSKDENWATEIRKAYPTDASWNREMEIDFSETTGSRAYPKFRRERNVRSDLIYNPSLPLCICCDFNVGIMIWPIAQIVKEELHIIDEVYLEPAAIPDMVREFRNKFPSPTNDINIYGDATGKARSAQSQHSDYDVLRNAFRGYSVPIHWNIPVKNPPVWERINSVNNLISGKSGEVRLFVHPRAENVIQDFLETLQDDKGIKKVTNMQDPYYRRSHGTDAVGYLASREMPVFKDALPSAKPRKQPKYSPNTFGMIQRPARRGRR